MNKFLLLFFLILFQNLVWGQYQDRFWIMGRTNSNGSFGNMTNVNIDFYPSLNLYSSTNPPSMDIPPSSISSNNGFEGWSVVTNATEGQLQFYTDGRSVFNGNHADITPAGGLGASPSSAQPTVVCVVPVCPFDRYYIFSNPTGNTGQANGFSKGAAVYREYSPSTGFSPSTKLPGPYGGSFVGEGMVIIPSKTNPFVFWLITRLLEGSASNKYVVYRIDNSGISYNGDFNFGPSMPSSPSELSPIMNMVFRDDGSINNVIVGFSSGYTNKVFTNLFDTNSGKFLNSTKVVAEATKGKLYDLEFSPNGQIIYFATYFPSVLYQVDLISGNVQEMKDFGAQRGGGLRIAPDGFVYHIANAGEQTNNGTVEIGRIVKPDMVSTGSSNFLSMYESNVVTFSNVFTYSFPDFVETPSWLSTQDGTEAFCQGSSTILSVNIDSLGVSVQSFDWYFGENLVKTTTDPFFEVSQAGVYTVVANIEGGCSIKQKIILKESVPPTIISSLSTDATCNSNSGTIQIIAAGEGQLQYSVDGINFQSGSTFSNLPAGNYSIIVRNKQGCLTEGSISIENPDAPQILNVSTLDASCGLNNGSIMITANGAGSLTYSIDGSNFQNAPSFLGLLAGEYTIRVADVNNCLMTESVEVLEPELPQIIATQVQDEICESNNGSISISATGINPIQYAIDGVSFQESNSFGDLSEGDYAVAIKDGNGCIANQPVTVQAPTLPVINEVEVVDALCGRDNGKISIIASGSSALSYSIDSLNYQLSNSFDTLNAGLYTIFLQDEDGCIDTQAVEIRQPNLPSITGVKIENATCDLGNGSIKVSANGEGTLTYALGDSIFGEDKSFANLLEGEYPVQVKDENGCISKEVVHLKSSPALVIESLAITPVDCGEHNGVLEVKVSGGTGLIDVFLNNVHYPSTFLLTDLIDGSYLLKLEDSLGCITDTMAILERNDCPIYVPNVFSPNSDEKNNIFKIFPHPDFRGEVVLWRIFDRWGNLVFEKRNFNQFYLGWDGKYKEEKLDPGVFIYVLEVIYGNGNKEVLTGDVTLIR